jgi:purine-nucleoside phosphorylase
MKKKPSRTRPAGPDVAAGIDASAAYLRSRLKHRPRIGIILGSGLGEFGDGLQASQSVPIDSVPHYPRATVEGHVGTIVAGKLGGISLLVFQGRVHLYESGDLESALYPIRIAHRMGIKILLLTNAAGGLHMDFRPADLMIITDHINLTFENPIKNIPPRSRGGELYDPEIRDIMRAVGREAHIQLREGVYCGIKGPSYETAAEVEMIRRIGGDAIGMSTVNEVALAYALGMRVGGISCITNLATGISPDKLTHREVTEVAALVKGPLQSLLGGVVAKLGTR